MIAKQYSSANQWKGNKITVAINFLCTLGIDVTVSVLRDVITDIFFCWSDLRPIISCDLRDLIYRYWMNMNAIPLQDNEIRVQKFCFH